MDRGFTFEVITPECVLFADEVYEVRLPTSQGEIGIMPHHARLRSLVTTGVVTIRQTSQTSADEAEYLALHGGVVEVRDKTVRLLADTAQRAQDIDELATQEALAQARALRHQAKDRVTLADATALIDRHITNLKVAQLRRKKSQTRERRT